MCFLSKRTLLILTGMMINLLASISYSFITPFFGPYSEKRNIQPIYYSLAIGLGDGMYCFSFFFIKLYGKVSTKKVIFTTIIIQTISVFLMSKTFMIQNNYYFLVSCILLRALSGFCLTILTMSSFALIIVKCKKNTATIMGFFEVAFCLGMIAGPSFGGYLYNKYGYESPFILVTILFLLCFIVSLLVFSGLEEIESNNRVSIKKILSNPLVLIIMLEIIFLSFVFALNNSLLSPFFYNNFLLNSFQIGLVFAAGSLFNALSTAIAGFMIDKGFNRNIISCFGTIFIFLSLIFLSPIGFLKIKPNLAMSIVFTIVLMSSNAVKYLATSFELIPIILSHGFKKDNIIVYIVTYAILYSSISIGIFLGSFLCGYLYQYYGFSFTSTSLGTSILLIFCFSRILYFNFEKKMKNELDEKKPLIQV